MDEPREDFALDPEAEKSIDQIADGLRRYLRLLPKEMTNGSNEGRSDVADRE